MDSVNFYTNSDNTDEFLKLLDTFEDSLKDNNSYNGISVHSVHCEHSPVHEVDICSTPPPRVDPKALKNISIVRKCIKNDKIKKASKVITKK